MSNTAPETPAPETPAPALVDLLAWLFAIGCRPDPRPCGRDRVRFRWDSPTGARSYLLWWPVGETAGRDRACVLEYWDRGDYPRDRITGAAAVADYLGYRKA